MLHKMKEKKSSEKIKENNSQEQKDNLIDREKLIKMQIFEQEANQLEEQIKLIHQEVIGLTELKGELKNLEKMENNEIFAEVKKGIYVKGVLKKEKLLVEIGSKIFVPKSFSEVDEVIDKEIKKLHNANEEIAERIIQINSEINELVKA
jgi:prefoldin alpha subunit